MEFCIPLKYTISTIIDFLSILQSLLTSVILYSKKPDI